MIPLAIGVAIPGEHARLTHLQTNTLSCHAAALGTADDDLVHHNIIALIDLGQQTKEVGEKLSELVGAKSS
jgi:hypothetical protein